MANQQSNKAKAGQGNRPTAVEPPETPGSIPAAGHDTTRAQRAAGSDSPVTGSSGIAPTPRASTASTDREAQPLSDEVKSTAGGIYDKAKETASETYDAVATKATTKIEERKGEFSTGLRTLADTFRRTGSELEGTPQSNQLTDLTARYTGTAANKVEQIANYFERKDLRAMMRDAEDFARRNPAIFLGAAFGLGMLAARFLKSSPPDRQASIQPRDLSTGTPAGLPSTGQTTDPVRTNP